MKIKELVWIGTRTEYFGAMLDFCQNVMGLTPAFVEPGFAALDMPNGDRFEIFGADSAYNTFYTHPVVGFRWMTSQPHVLRWKPTGSNSSTLFTRKKMAMPGPIFGRQTVLCTH